MAHLVAVLTLASFVGQASPPVATSIDRLAWLHGCWEGTNPKKVIVEQWMKPDGGAMLGMGRTVVDGRVREFEFMRVWTDAHGDIFFTADPSGQTEASFKLVEMTDSSVTFENPEHDFPQRIIYRRQPDGGLVARIEGTNEGKQMAIDFPMRRGRCDD